MSFSLYGTQVSLAEDMQLEYRQGSGFTDKRLYFKQHIDQKSIILPSSTVVMPKEPKNIIKKVGSIGYSRGIHHWEIWAIQDCKDLHIGVIMDDVEKGKNLTQTFNASTSRVIRVRLDLVKLQLDFFLNGNINEKKRIALTQGTFYPLVSHGGQSKIFGITPFWTNSLTVHVPGLPFELRPMEKMQLDSIVPVEQEIQETFDHVRSIGQNYIYFKDGNIKLARGETANLFRNNPQQTNSIVTLWLRPNEFKSILEFQDWHILAQNQFTTPEYIIHFKRVLSTAKMCRNKIYFDTPFLLVKQITQAVLQYIKPDSDSHKNSLIIYSMLLLDEQLWAMAWNIDSKSELAPYIDYWYQIPRMYSQFSRLQTFIDNSNIQNPIELVQQGLLRMPVVGNVFRHFENPDQPLEIITKRQQICIESHFDIPLDVTINSIPYKEKAYDSIIKSDENSVYISVLQGDNIVIYNGELVLQKVGSVGIKEELKPQNNPVIEEESFAQNLFEEAIVPDQDLLNQMYQMGFSLEISKLALIEVKNVGLDQALDAVAQLQEKKAQGQQQVLAPQEKELKIQWSCKQCTFSNTNVNLKCQICEAEPGEDAYVSQVPEISEEERLLKEQTLLKETEAQQEIERQQQEEEYRKNAVEKVIYQFYYDHKLYFIISFTYEGEHAIVIKKLQYSHLDLFQTTQQQQASEQTFSIIDNLKSNININHESNRFIVQTLYPVYTGQDIFELKSNIWIPTESEIIDITQQGDKLLLHSSQKSYQLNVVDNTIIELENKSSAFTLRNRQFESKQNELYLNEQKIADLQDVTEVTSTKDGLIIKKNGQFSEISLKDNKIDEQFQQQEQEVDQDLSNLTGDQIQDLRQLNEKKEIYFEAQSHGTLHLFKQNQNKYASIIASPDSTLQLNCSPCKLLQLKLTAMSDDQIQEESQLLNLVKSESVPADQLQQLAMTIHYNLGSQFNYEYQIAKTCFIQENTFTSLYSKPEYVYRELHNKTVVIQQYSVSSVTKALPMGQALQSGLIYVSNDANAFLHIDRSISSHQEYLEWKTARSKDQTPLQPWEPVSYFKIPQTEESITVDLEQPLIARYVLMRPLTTRTNQPQTFENACLAFNYFILRGRISKEDPLEITIKSKKSQEIFQNLKVYLDGQHVDPITEYYKEQQPNGKSLYIASLSFQHNITSVKIELNQPSVTFIKVQGFQQNQQLLAKIPNAQLITSLMHDVNQYDKFNIKLMKLIHDENASLEQRIACIKVLCTLFQNSSPQVLRCYQDFDCLTYLRLNVLSLSREQGCVQQLLSHFSIIPNFTENLTKSVKTLVNNIFVEKVRASGFAQLIFILKRLSQHNPLEFFSYLVDHLKVALKLLANNSDPLYEQLSTQGVSMHLLEEKIFSEKYILMELPNEGTISEEVKTMMLQQGTTNQDSTLQLHPKKPLISTIKYRKQLLTEIFEIDLLCKYDLSQLRLVFNKNVNTKILRIQLSAEGEPVFDYTYNESLLLQVTKLAEQFKDQAKKLNLVVLPIQVQARKLTLQLTYLHSVINRSKEEENNGPKEQTLIPEFKGLLVNNESVYESKQQKLQVEQQGFVTFENALPYSQYKVDDYFILDSSGTFEKDTKLVLRQGAPIEKKSEISINNDTKVKVYKEHLLKYQKELRDKLEKKINIQEQPHLHYVPTIRRLLLELLKIEEPPELRQSQDFLSTFIYELIWILLDINQTHKEWKQQTQLSQFEGLKLCQLIYNSLILKSKGVLSGVALELLNVLLENLTLKHWIVFAFQNYADPNIEKLALIKIPVAQTIVYLQKQNQLKLIDLVIQKLKQVQESPKEFEELKLTRSTSSDEFSDILQECNALTPLTIYKTAFELLSQVLKQEKFIGLYEKTTQLFLLLKNDDISFISQICNLAEPHKSPIAEIILLSQSIHLPNIRAVLDKLFSHSEEAQRMIFYTLSTLFSHVIITAHEKQAQLMQFLAAYLIQKRPLLLQPQTLRKKSSKQQIGSTYSDFCEDLAQIQPCSTEAILKLLQLLPDEKMNLNFWGLFLNVLLNTQVQQLIEHRIFEQTLDIYFNKEPTMTICLASKMQDVFKLILEYTQKGEIYQYVLKASLSNGDRCELFSLMNAKGIKLKNVSPLYQFIGDYLIKECNYGRQDGVSNCPVKDLNKMHFANQCLQLLLNGEYLRVLKENPDFTNLIHWYMLNRIIGPSISPATEYLLQISKNIRLLFEGVTNDLQLTMEAVTQLFKFQKQLDVTLENVNLTNNLRYTIVKNTQEIFEELNEIWMTTDQVVREVAIKGNGFEYLLEKTHLVQNQRPTVCPATPTEEEFATKITLFDPNGQKASFQAKDWSTHKKGAKSKQHSIAMTDKNYEEFPLEFELEKSIELKQLRIGFQVYSADLNDKIWGCPQHVTLEVKGQNLWYPLGTMLHVEDEAYTFHSIKVFAYNSYRMTHGNTLTEQIKSISQMPIKWIRFVIKRPRVTFLEHISQLSFKQYTNIHIAISFISITGFEDQQYQYQQIQEQTASRLLGKMCASKFRSTLQDISKNETIIEQIKKSFSNVSTALQMNESTLAPLFIGLTTYNPEFGDWVLRQLYSADLECAHAKLCAEIVLQDKAKQSERLNSFLEFVISLLKDIKNAQLYQISFFIEALTYAIIIASKTNDKLLTVKENHINIVIEAIEVLKQQPQSNMVIKLAVTLLNLDKAKTPAVIKQLYSQYLQNKQSYVLRLLSALIQIDHEQIPLDVILEDAFKSLQINDSTSIHDYFFFIDSAANIPTLKQYLLKNQYHIRVYQGLKQKTTKSLLRIIDPSAIPFIVSFIGKCTLSDPETIKEFSLRLIDDIQTLSQIVDINYVENILMPLLNFEQKTDFTIDLWDRESQQFVGDIRKLSTKLSVEQEQSEENEHNELNGFISNGFTKLQEQQLLIAIQKLGKSLKRGGKWTKELELTQGAQQFSNALQILQKGPFMIVLHGKNGNSGEQCIVGLFSTQTCGELQSDFTHDYYPNEVYPIPDNGEQFGFAYQKDKIYHLLNNDPKSFGVGFEHENGGQFSFLLERINLILSDDQQDISSVSIGIHDFELLETKPEEDYYFDDFWLARMEIWSYSQPKSSKVKVLQLNQVKMDVSGSTFGYGILASSILQEKYFNKQSVYNYFNATPIYSLPSTCQSENILQVLKVSNLSVNEAALAQPTQVLKNSLAEEQPNKIVKSLQIDGIELLNQLNSSSENHLQYNSVMPIFDSFQAQDGVKQIILAVTNAIQTWSNQELRVTWKQYIEELQAFCSVPQFFSYFLKNKQSMELLFQLLAGVPDLPSTDQTIWKEKEMDAVKFIYDTLSEVFKSNNTQEIRIIAIKDKLILKILDRIAIVAKEKKRYFDDQTPVDLFDEEPKKVQEKPEKTEKAVLKKKQGVGYGSDHTGQNQKWNTQEYLDKKKVRSEQLKSLLDIIRNFFNQSWVLSEELAAEINTLVFESALLPILEAAFRSGSLLEMSKDSDLNLAYLSLTKIISKHKFLAPLLMKIPDTYRPRQIESVSQLLANLKNVASIFIACLNSQELSEKDMISKQIAVQILETHQSVQDVIQRYEHQGDDVEYQIEKSLPKAYRQLLQDLRFDYVSFKNAAGQYQHFYERYISQAAQPLQTKLIRLAQEFADMSNSLPIEHTNAIFVRADKDRVDVMKAMIMGASGTPYAHGAYVFDIYFDESYPNNPPKMNLATTGAGKIRFNPNLYACGKVCLSLLGTWRGHASENWDPKLSTILQVLVSTQAIIMSEDVYFNEPGFEGEAGTAEGEAKNEAYCNIVRYGNVAFAMIDTIKNPPEGFEDIVKRHFYLKRDEIMEEVNKWVEYAEQRNASYQGLVLDHNNNWCTQFKKQKGSYHEMLKEQVAELKKLLYSMEMPVLKQKSKQTIKQKQIIGQDIKEGMMDLNNVDVTYDKQKEQTFDVNDEAVKDRWSRYIGAMGLDAVKKQSSAKILLSGVGALGVEIAKNIVLSGVNTFSIFDNHVITQDDLVGQFFIGESDIGSIRSKAVLEKIQQLNSYVRVNVIEKEVHNQCQKYDVIILTDVYNQQELIMWGNYCRQYGIKLVISNVNGVYARIINDFGPEFTVIDKNGEDLPDVMIKSISTEGIVELLQGQKAQYEDGDTVTFSNVEGLLLDGKSINGQGFKVKTINSHSFKIDLPEGYTPYVRNGLVKHIKVPTQIKFKSYEELTQNEQFDANMLISDFMKLNEPQFMHQGYKSMALIEKFNDVEFFIQQTLKRCEDKIPKEQFNHFIYYLTVFAHYYQSVPFPPLVAYIGGFASQEVIKAITNKYTPINQIYYTDCIEVLPVNMYKENEPLPTIELKSGLNGLLGDELTTKLQKLRLFMVGCGAIGCELLKNFATLNIAIEGQLTITDPDHIETSNLNRQFLFREKHLHKSKSQTAAASIIQMNPKLKNTIIARQDRVQDATEHIFNEQFFDSLDIVANALDNVQARRYVDQRCVKAQKPLLESGTLGPKGHVQCIIPFQTESYGSMNDPVEEGDIPYCTLKMFPEETFHCVEFARDKFSKLFTLKPKILAKALEQQTVEPKELRQAIKLLQGAPKSFDQCVEWARHKYQKYFVNDIKQLLYTYPLDTKTKDGQLFWTMPKRPPREIEFDYKNELQSRFISTLAFLRASLFGIPTPQNWRTELSRSEVTLQADKVNVRQWQPDESKKKEIVEQVSTQKQQQEEPEEQIEQSDDQETFNKLPKIKIFPQEFEKDSDHNGHIDFIHAFGNLRAANYQLDAMDWLTVKLKAGRIVPALATTTAAIAGLQVIELVKLIKQIPKEHMKNAFLNLAVPILSLTEPGAPQQITLGNQKVTLWDRWEVKNGSKLTLKELFESLSQAYNLEPQNLFYRSAPIYSSLEKDAKKREELLNTKLTDLFAFEKHIDVAVTFVKEGQIVENTPEIRIYY